ncbi:30S ribosomal protein S6 [Terriglobus sp. RCC_193]|uniref:30S ribosomal protein S6 n=1 Tax=Terriglobus sp. RCC_193 TaxID=3239218 RepID=UPI0035266B16
MNRTYEVMYIIRPDLEEADLDKLIEGFTAVVTNGGGEVTQTEKLGRRRLAYVVRKFQDGLYVLMHVSADGPLVAELERRLRVTEQVIKFITVRTDEENKRLAKIKAHRDSRVKVSDQQAAAAAAAAAAVAAEAPVAVAAVEAPVAVEAPAETEAAAV